MEKRLDPISVSTGDVKKFIEKLQKCDLTKFDLQLSGLKEKEKNSILNLLRFKTNKVRMSKRVKLKNRFYNEMVKFYLLNCEYGKYEFKSIFQLIFQFTKVEYVCLSYSARKLIGNELPSFLIALREKISLQKIDFRLMNLYSFSLRDDIQKKYYVTALISKEVNKVFSTHTDMDGNRKFGKLLFTANEERNRHSDSKAFSCMGAFMKYPPERLLYCKEILGMKLSEFG